MSTPITFEEKETAEKLYLLAELNKQKSLYYNQVAERLYAEALSVGHRTLAQHQIPRGIPYPFWSLNQWKEFKKLIENGSITDYKQMTNYKDLRASMPTGFFTTKFKILQNSLIQTKELSNRTDLKPIDEKMFEKICRDYKKKLDEKELEKKESPRKRRKISETNEGAEEQPKEKSQNTQQKEPTQKESTQKESTQKESVQTESIQKQSSQKDRSKKEQSQKEQPRKEQPQPQPQKELPRKDSSQKDQPAKESIPKSQPQKQVPTQSVSQPQKNLSHVGSNVQKTQKRRKKKNYKRVFSKK
eukprot:TRINITY_DN2031_c0_g1_i1.p1 TRINITY_DN2031_c0_g1~~TRINITY_DN2031_c0_g1_i1.p1  ORF type:complete len:301 (-),score=78.96 TRINITY_DN2031_c0_g1_i1:4-906(-)